MSLGDQLAREVEKKRKKKKRKRSGGKGSDEQHLVRTSSVDRAERSGDFTFTADDSPFHLWYPVKLRIGGRDYESAGHYLVMKSLGNCHTYS